MDDVELISKYVILKEAEDARIEYEKTYDCYCKIITEDALESNYSTNDGKTFHYKNKLNNSCDRCNGGGCPSCEPNNYI